MDARTRQLVLLAMTTALMAPVAMAQTAKDAGKTRGQTAAPAAQQSPPRSPPPRATAPQAQQFNASEPPQPPEVEQAAMNPPKPLPVTAQGAADAADPSAIAWAQLDVDGDGRISASEAQVDTDFKAHFKVMDADRDGFVSDAEFRAHAKAGHDQGDKRETRDEEDRDD